MIDQEDIRPEWQQADPALELVWLESSSHNYAVTLDNQDGTEEDVVSFVSSSDMSNEDNSSQEADSRNNSSASTPSRSRRVPLASLTVSKKAAEDNVQHVLVRKETKTSLRAGERENRSFFRCGFDSTCESLSSSESTAGADDDTLQTEPDEEIQMASHVLDTTSKWSEACSCVSMFDDSGHTSLLQSAKENRQRAFSRRTSDHCIRRNLPEEHGPIRRDLNDDDAISYKNSEATTETASNVSYPKLASTILTSQASKKAVEPMDRTAALLESKGVGRGMSSVKRIRESINLRLFLDDYSHAHYWPLLDSLVFNKCLRKLVLFRRRKTDLFRIRTHQEIDCLFRVLNCRTCTLSELHLWNFGPDDQPILARALAYNFTLEYLQLHLETGTINSFLATALATLPKLVSLEAEVSSSFPVATLLDSKSLAVLTIICTDNPFDLDVDETLALARKLEFNQTLSILNLEPCISCDLGLPAILECLQSSNRTLETFQFSCATSNVQQGDRAMEYVLEVLHTNPTLRVAWNNCYESWTVSPKMRQKVLQTLQENQTIQQFHIFAEAADYWHKKNNVLENNMTTVARS